MHRKQPQQGHKYDQPKIPFYYFTIFVGGHFATSWSLFQPLVMAS